MKVKELIKKLQKFDPEIEVAVDGYETGYDIVKDAYIINVIPAPSDKGWYDGEFVDAEQKPISWLQDTKQVVYIPRSS